MSHFCLSVSQHLNHLQQSCRQSFLMRGTTWPGLADSVKRSPKIPLFTRISLLDCQRDQLISAGELTLASHLTQLKATVFERSFFKLPQGDTNKWRLNPTHRDFKNYVYFVCFRWTRLYLFPLMLFSCKKSHNSLSLLQETEWIYIFPCTFTNFLHTTAVFLQFQQQKNWLKHISRKPFNSNNNN